MVHSVELLFDPDTESAIRSVWQALSDVGLAAMAQTSRPHATMVVADQIAEDVDTLLPAATRQLPFPCVIGAPMLFGRSSFILVKHVVPTTQLLAIQAEVLSTCMPHLTPGPASNTVVGQWTPHVTLARRVDAWQFKRALRIRDLSRDIQGSIVGLRRWDGNKRIEHLIR
jgi:2'-5' RNA ligase